MPISCGIGPPENRLFVAPHYIQEKTGGSGTYSGTQPALLEQDDDKIRGTGFGRETQLLRARASRSGRVMTM